MRRDACFEFIFETNEEAAHFITIVSQFCRRSYYYFTAVCPKIKVVLLRRNAFIGETVVKHSRSGNETTQAMKTFVILFAS